jgi:hypothetical protein
MFLERSEIHFESGPQEEGDMPKSSILLLGSISVVKK